MKQRILSLFCTLVLLLGAIPAAAALEGESRQAAETLASLKLIDAVPSDEALKQPATRLQATKLLVRLSGVSDESLATGAQEYAVSQGWVTVTGGQHEAIPTGEYCASLLRELGYEGFTDENAVLFARRVALTARDYDETLTLGDLYELTRDALVFPGRDGETVAEHLAAAGYCTQAAVQKLLPEELTARQMADRHMAAVFKLNTFYTEKEYEENKASNGGSAFFVSADGLAVTNYHTLEEAVRATATLVTGETFDVERVLFFDPDNDLALLRVSKTTTDKKTTVPFFSHLEIAKEPDLRQGDQVYTIGVPLGIAQTISSGVISAADHMMEFSKYPCVLNTADISHGSSGGVLLNVYGHVIGVTTGAYSNGNNLYISVSLIPILEADWTAEGIPLEEVREAARNAGTDKK